MTDYSLIEAELEKVRNEGKGYNVKIEVQLLVNEEWIEPLMVDGLSLERNYVGGFGDIRVITVLFPQGKFYYDILPYKNDLWVTIKFVNLTESEITDKTFRAFVMNLDDAGLDTSVSNQQSRSALDLQPPLAVELQLIEDYAFKCQLRTIGGVYRSVTPYEVLLAILTDTINTNGKQDNSILGVNTRGIPSTVKRTQIIVPHGTRISNVGNWLQDKEGGIFSAGLGTYLQDNYWYIFSLYDVQHKSKKSKTLTVYAMPTDRYGDSELTYRVEGDRIIILVSGNITTVNMAENRMVAKASGYRFLNASTLLTDYGVSKDNRLMVDKASNLFEVAEREIKPGESNVQWGDTRATANPLRHYTALAETNGRLLSAQWKHGDASLLIPGMLTEYFTVMEGKIVGYKGVLLGIRHNLIKEGVGAVTQRHNSLLSISLFVENKPFLIETE